MSDVVTDPPPAPPVPPPGSARPELTADDVRHLARLARLELTAAELDTFRGQLTVILDSVAQVSEVAAGPDAAGIEPTTHAVPLVNVFRPDTLVVGLDRDAALRAAPAVENDRFQVPQILGEEQ